MCCLARMLLVPLLIRAMLHTGRYARVTRVGSHCARSRGFTSTRRISVDSWHLSVPHTVDRTRRGAAARGLGEDVDRCIGERGLFPYLLFGIDLALAPDSAPHDGTLEVSVVVST